MSENNEEIIELSKGNELSKKNPFNEDTILTIILFILIINQFNKKHPFSSEQAVFPEDDYTVTMGKNPAFPLDKDDETNINKEKKAILNIENQQDLFSMINSLKPHMSIKNRRIINIFEKWQVLMDELNVLSKNFEDENDTLDISVNQPKNIVNFLYDLKPFIHPEYHYQIQQFTNGINSILDIQKNISNLQNTLSHINNINDNTKKVNNLVEALQPFMGENQKKTVNQLKNISQVLNMVKMAEDIKESTKDSNITNEAKDQDDKKSQLMEILDIFDSPPNETKDEEHKENLDEIIEQPGIQEQENEKIFEERLEHEEQEYEEIFEETIEFEEPEVLKEQGDLKQENDDIEENE